MKMGELAIRYLLSLVGLTSVVIGVETLEQLEANLAFFQRGPLSDDTLTAIDLLRLAPSDLEITPRLWPAR
jgi:aryl-alcohol dehydrogenase-like predicted oxidoreductase